ncbi:hypothetical protein ANN_00687 [Periplaneta americana]|uniref:Uncharacterized protein n=1 Tax=Periplaneta americana TaxID=6978 RepID=A0ABQ8TRH0_PERAM|nr:hypothetical protein ANN_00687 [Periplaneta americana]
MKLCWKEWVKKNDTETDQEEEKKLAGSLAEKKLPAEGCIRRNDELEKSLGEQGLDGSGSPPSSPPAYRRLNSREENVFSRLTSGTTGASEQQIGRGIITVYTGKRYEHEGEVFLRCIITIDETWARSYEPQLKRQSAQVTTKNNSSADSNQCEGYADSCL